MRTFRNALDLIYNTPLINLNRIYSGPGKLLVKAEFVQPGGSVKDRAAKKIMERAYDLGLVQQGTPVVEMTSGNMGAGLAAATEEAKRIALKLNGYYVDQFNNPASVLAHEETTGPEIWDQTEGKVDAFLAAVGSSGTFTGTSKFLKSKNSKIRCFAVEPLGAEVIAGKTVSKPKHILQGTGYGSVPPHWDKTLADGFFSVNDEEANHYRKLLAEKEGLFVGFSAAANVAASIKLLDSNELGEDPTVVTILCDTGLKY